MCSSSDAFALVYIYIMPLIVFFFFFFFCWCCLSPDRLWCPFLLILCRTTTTTSTSTSLLQYSSGELAQNVSQRTALCTLPVCLRVPVCVLLFLSLLCFSFSVFVPCHEQMFGRLSSTACLHADDDWLCCWWKTMLVPLPLMLMLRGG